MHIQGGQIHNFKDFDLWSYTSQSKSLVFLLAAPIPFLGLDLIDPRSSFDIQSQVDTVCQILNFHDRSWLISHRFDSHWYMPDYKELISSFKAYLLRSQDDGEFLKQYFMGAYGWHGLSLKSPFCFDLVLSLELIGGTWTWAWQNAYLYFQYVRTFIILIIESATYKCYWLLIALSK